MTNSTITSVPIPPPPRGGVVNPPTPKETEGLASKNIQPSERSRPWGRLAYIGERCKQIWQSFKNLFTCTPSEREASSAQGVSAEEAVNLNKRVTFVQTSSNPTIVTPPIVQATGNKTPPPSFPPPSAFSNTSLKNPPPKPTTPPPNTLPPKPTSPPPKKSSPTPPPKLPPKPPTLNEDVVKDMLAGISLEYACLERAVTDFKNAQQINIKELGGLYCELQQTHKQCTEIYEGIHGFVNPITREHFRAHDVKLLTLEIELKAILEKHKNSLVQEIKKLNTGITGPNPPTSLDLQRYMQIREMVINYSPLLGFSNHQDLLPPIPSNVMQLIKKPLAKKATAVGPVRGIANLGASCYINASLQVLFASKHFQRQLLQPCVRRVTVNAKTKARVAEDTTTYYNRLAAHRALQRCYAVYNDPMKTSYDVSVAVRDLRNAAFRFANREDFNLNPTGQKDAAPFIEVLFDIVGISFQSKLWCEGRGERGFYSSENTVGIEPMTVQQVSIIPRKSFQDLVHSVAVEAKNDPENAWKYEYGSGKDDHEMISHYTRRIQITDKPPLLVMQLKRFQQVQRSTLGVVYVDTDKITDPVAFPVNDRIDLGRLMKENHPVYYRLIGVVNHSGSLNFGHYIAHSKVGDVWARCNDSWVDAVNSEIVDRERGYLFVLERCDEQTSSSRGH